MGFLESVKRLFGREGHSAPHGAGDPAHSGNAAQPSALFRSKHANLIEAVESGKPEERVTALGVLVNVLWSSDAQEQADAVKFMAALLRHPDLATVHKAAGGLAELGGIGTLYMEKAVLDPAVTEGARAAILSRARMVEAAGNGHMRVGHDLSEAGLEAEARKVVEQALSESRWHGFSSNWGGRIQCRQEGLFSYSFDIDLGRSKEMQALISFGRVEKVRVEDPICLRVTKAFAQGAPYSEIQGIPTQRGLRYFGWPVKPSRPLG